MKKLIKHLIIVSAVLVFLAFPASAMAETVSLAFEATAHYGVGSAQNEMLTYINNLRAENGLSPLTLNKTHTEHAMQRAMECQMLYSHARPDGSLTPWSVYTCKGTNHAENITLAKTTAYAYAMWEQSPGHKENMLSPKYKSVGIGDVSIAGDAFHAYETMFCSYEASNSSPSGDVKKIFYVAVPTGLEVKFSKSCLSELRVGDSTTYIPTIGFTSQVPIHYSSMNYSSGNTSVITIDTMGNARAVGAGTAVITASVKNCPSMKVSMTVTVKPALIDINNYSFRLADTEIVKTGGPVYSEIITNAPSGSYSSFFYNNVGYGTASVDIEGKGEYCGKLTLHFEIVSASESGSTGGGTSGSGTGAGDNNSGTGGTSTTPEIKYSLNTPVMISAKNSRNGVTVKWEKVSKATGYWIYRKGPGETSYKRIATVSDGSTCSYLDLWTNVKSGKRYHYKVTAIKTSAGMTETSAQSAVKSLYYIEAPVVTQAGNHLYELHTAKVKWYSVSNVTGYQVGYRIGTGTETKLKVYGQSNNEKNIKLKAGKTYRIRVRSYKVISNKRYYSAWSTYNSVKIS